MDRVVVVGCGGSGKSYLARLLSERTGLPVTHLDAVYYAESWRAIEPDVFARSQQELVEADRWIIDGNYASTLPIRLRRADTVLFLDLAAWRCLLGILRRRMRHGPGQHRAIGVYNRITAQFVKYVWSYRRTMRPRILGLITEHARHAEVHVLTSRRAVQCLFNTAPVAATSTGDSTQRPGAVYPNLEG